MRTAAALILYVPVAMGGDVKLGGELLEVHTPISPGLAGLQNTNLARGNTQASTSGREVAALGTEPLISLSWV